MSFSKDLTTLSFIKEYINNSSIVKSTKLDNTIKAIINSLIKDKKNSIKSFILIEYLNSIRIVYYLKRLKYYNLEKAKTFNKLIFNTNKKYKSINLDYSSYIIKYKEDLFLKKEFYKLNLYLLYYSILFKDNNLITSFLAKGIFSKEEVSKARDLSYNKDYTSSLKEKFISKDIYFLKELNKYNSLYSLKEVSIIKDKKEKLLLLLSSKDLYINSTFYIDFIYREIYNKDYTNKVELERKVERASTNRKEIIKRIKDTINLEI
ncbi:hypothetical protein AUEXF2481DRAFT_91996 [Aureobasidium subglaciale EXF-2481]|uniref:Uncharacterized protein n=1 Tax=Aureobasidium subglaciale (strain EXF-2481) TaxID=1043005 RepID=A0A074Y6D2_AURSE|nr:uncharacterized protein AUEXF2481DRAFT_91996 [Aureobasidium subglaciale EXF-2481]KEQ91514.1 hypothetical protein AUEXF2481DRAFT_91996 [Aureobasidium subglaciale EXF-2481]